MARHMVAYGAAGLLVTPVLVFVLTLGLAYALDDRCGTPGDSGGCEMGAASLAIASVIPGLALGAAAGAFVSIRRG
ncbi:MAG: hypothetical protein EA385_13765 [Salinarimonadaceae bacterium]|nr:MAG: hypothetical protein EA385_13765 [Salinarimonadaceae bacterium]